MFYQGSNDLTGLTGWMAYVKMPVNKSAAIPNLDAANHPGNREGEYYSRLFIGQYAIKDEAMAWPNLGSADVRILDKNGTEWQTLKASEGFVDLPNGSRIHKGQAQRVGQYSRHRRRGSRHDRSV